MSKMFFELNEFIGRSKSKEKGCSPLAERNSFLNLDFGLYLGINTIPKYDIASTFNFEKILKTSQLQLYQKPAKM